jgi:hypothetical protein
VQISLQDQHLHLIAEAASASALARGMQAFQIAIEPQDASSRALLMSAGWSDCATASAAGDSWSFASPVRA